MAELKQESKMGLSFELRNFTGTEKWYKTQFGGLLYTDGIKYLAEQAGAYWLVDAIASYQPEWKHIPFQIWRLSVDKDKTALLTMQEDDGEPSIVVQDIGYSDFPLKEITLYVENKVICLPSER